MSPSPVNSEETRPASSSSANFSFRNLLPWIIGAGFVSTLLWLGFRNQALRAENEVLQTRRTAAELAQRSVEAQLEERTLIAEEMINNLRASLRQIGDPRLLRVSFLVATLSNLPHAQGSAVWDPSTSTGLLIASELPSVGPEQIYQIWLTDPMEDRAVSGGIFQPGTDGKAAAVFKVAQPITETTIFVVSLEKRGGAGARSGPTVLKSKR